MGYDEQKRTLTAPLNTFSVARCIGLSSYSIGRLCSSQNLINKWAKWKPESNSIRLLSPSEFTLTQRQRNNFGLSLPTASSNILDVVYKIIDNEDDGWEYKQIDANKQYTNLADFLHPEATKDNPIDGYYKDAYAPIQGIMVNGGMYDYTSDDALFDLLLLANESQTKLGLSAPTSGEAVDTSKSLYITLNDLHATINGKAIKDCYFTLVYGNTIFGLNGTKEFKMVGALSSDKTIAQGGTITLKTGNNGILYDANGSFYDAFIVGSVNAYENGVANTYFRLPFTSTRRMQGAISVVTAPPMTIQWLSIAFEPQGTLYGAGVSGADLSTNGDIYLVGIFTNDSDESLTLESIFNVSANRNFVGEGGTGKHPATTYVYNGSDLTLSSLQKDVTSYSGTWGKPTRLTFNARESKVLMVGVNSLLLYNQTETGAIMPPARPMDVQPMNIAFSLTYRGNSYNGDWQIAPVRKIGYKG